MAKDRGVIPARIQIRWGLLCVESMLLFDMMRRRCFACYLLICRCLQTVFRAWMVSVRETISKLSLAHWIAAYMSLLQYNIQGTESAREV